MVQLCVLGFVLFFACYGQFESGLSAYGVEAAGVSTSALGTALAANTMVIVVAQFAVLKFVERRRRSRVIAAVGLLWALAWAIAGYAGLGHGSQTMATAAFVSTYALFGLGEAMLSPTLAPLVADLAPSGMAGQYNSAFALVKQLALAVGPAVGGPLAASLPAPYVVTFLLFSLGITFLAVRLGRSLTPPRTPLEEPRGCPGGTGSHGRSGGHPVLRVSDGSLKPAGSQRTTTRCFAPLDGPAQRSAGSPGQRELAPHRLATARRPARAPVRGDRRHDRDAPSRPSCRLRATTAGQMVVAVRHLDDQPTVRAPEAQPHRRTPC